MYQEIYKEFQTKCENNSASAVDAGQAYVKLTSLYANYNLDLAYAKKALSRVIADTQSKMDDATGKPVTSAKAEILSRATPESDSVVLSEAHVNNLSMMIQTLKKYQEGLAQEFSHNS